MEEIAEYPSSFQHEMPCPYFREVRTATLQFVVPDPWHSQSFHSFLARGYRRVGGVFYHNTCEICDACKPLRIVTAAFALSRSQKRTLRKNRDIRVEIGSPGHLTTEKLDLYQKYLTNKHGDCDDRELLDHESQISMVHFGYPQTIEMDYYAEDRLIGVGIVDEAADSLSSNYFYYDTDYLDRRLGIFSALKEISLARFMGKRYYYLGFYIEETQKMSYKRFLRPNQVYEGGVWRDFAAG